MLKKLLTIILIIVIVFNFIFNIKIYANLGEESTQDGADEGDLPPGVIDNVDSSGADASGNPVNLGVGFWDVVLQYVAGIINCLPITIQALSF